MSVYDCTRPETRDEGVRAAATALSRGQLVVLPTDTVYGIGAAAFDPEAVAALLAAKGRGRQSPPPVLVGAVATLGGLATQLPPSVPALVEAFWPGPLTVICRAHQTLAWDLGDTGGTVALRMPDDEVALALLARTGPLAVSSANRHGQPAATTVLEAAAALGERVDVYLDGGRSRGGVASTIVDATGPTLRVVRAGALSREELAAVVPEIADDDDARQGRSSGGDDDVQVPPSGRDDAVGVPPSGGDDDAQVPPSGRDDAVGVPPSGGDDDAQVPPSGRDDAAGVSPSGADGTRDGADRP